MSTNYVPAIKAKMGDWTYYITKMKFGEVAAQVKLAEEIHKNKELDNLIQRELSDRVASMTQFLLTEKQRFYGSLVVAIYKGNPVFRPIKIDEGNSIVDSVNHSFGLLQMDGSQTYFALDGQHRLSSIKAACDENPDLKDEEISVLVIKHDETKEGLVRTRRLFTKLNRYAKATDQKTNISLDEDDCIAITTRRMAREFDRIKSLIKIDSKSKQISTSKADEKYLTTLAAIYECNAALADTFRNGEIQFDKGFLSKRPEDDFLDELYDYIVGIWGSLIDATDHLRKTCDESVLPGKLRNDIEPSIWMRPITQLLVCDVIKRGIIGGHAPSIVIKRIGSLPSSLNSEPWVDIIWDKNLKQIKSGKAHRDFLVDLVGVALDIDNAVTKKELRQRYGEYFGKANKEIPALIGATTTEGIAD